MPKATLNNSIVLVTGAGGFIGKTVVTTLLAAGYTVVAMVRPGKMVSLPQHQNLQLIRADILKYSSYCDKVSQVDCIVHLAANKYDPRLSYLVNVKGARNLIRLVTEKKLRNNRIINMSSQATKHRWKGVYGKSKLLADEIIQNSHADWTTLMPNLVYSAQDGSLFLTIVNFTRTLPFIPLIGDGSWRLFPITVEDVARYVVSAIKQPKSVRKIFELGSVHPITFDDFIKLIQSELGIKKPIVHIPVWLGLPAVWAITRLLPHFPVSVDNVIGSNQQVTCDCEKSIRDLNVIPTTVEVGVRKYLAASRAPSGDRKTHVAIVGLGKMGILHASVLSVLPNVKIVALIDMDKQLGKMAQSMGVDARFYLSLDDALQQESIDTVFIATPTHVHKIIIAQCLKAKLPFFVEKTVMRTFDDFKLLQSTSRELSLSVAGYFWIFRREVRYVKRLLEEDAIGTIQSYTCSLKHAQVFGKKSGWQFDKTKSGGGVLMNDGPHPLSLLVYLFGAGKVETALLEYRYGNSVEDVANVTIAHEKRKSGAKVIGNLTTSWSEPDYPVMTVEFEIIGSKGSIRFAQDTLTIVKNGQKKIIPFYQIPAPSGVFNLSPRSGGDAYYLEDAEFIANLRSGQPSIHNLDFARNVELIIHQAYATAQSK